MTIPQQIERIVLNSSFAQKGAKLDALTILTLEGQFLIDITHGEAKQVLTVPDLIALVERKVSQDSHGLQGGVKPLVTR